jgi:hypothetical protein
MIIGLSIMLRVMAMNIMIFETAHMVVKKSASVMEGVAEKCE